VTAPTAVVVYPTVVAPRTRYYGSAYVYRPYGPAYFGYGYYYTDSDAFKWLAFTAITLKLVDELSEAQARKYEQAQIEATTAAVGESITWEEGEASGSVTVVRQGTSTSGKQCREFQQEVTIGGKSESAYGPACLQDDGSWKIVS
jgi:17 kDa outer membrane surface antigen